MDILNSMQAIEANDVSELLLTLFSTRQNDFTGFTVEEIVKWITNQLKNKNVNFSPKVFEKLIANMFATYNKNTNNNSLENHRQLVVNILECIQLQVRKFPGAESNYLLDLLWSLCLNGDQVHLLAEQVFDMLFDDFVRSLGLKCCSQILSVIDPLKQVIYGCEQSETPEMPIFSNNLLPNANSINSIFPRRIILYFKLIQSDNISIVYETVKHILIHWKISYFTESNMLEKFLAATNKMQLYNVDREVSLFPLFDNFVSTNEVELLIEALDNVSWEWNSVPLTQWIKSIPTEEQVSCIKKNILIKLASRIQRMTNRELQISAQEMVLNRFQVTLNNLTLLDYLMFIETMYKNNTKNYSDHDRFRSKFIDCDSTDVAISCLTLWLDIVFNGKIKNDLVLAFIDKLKNLSKTLHGWLRFYLITKINCFPSILDFYKKEYEVEPLILHCKDLNKLQNHLLDKLMCETNEEKCLVKQFSVDIFVNYQIKKWNNITVLQLESQQLLEQGGYATFKCLCRLLVNCEEQLQDDVLSTFVASLKKFPNFSIARNIGSYVSKHLTEQEQTNLSQDILFSHLDQKNIDVIFGYIRANVKKSSLKVIRKILQLTTFSDDAWIEYCYQDNNSLLSRFLSYIREESDRHVKEVGDELLRMNMELFRNEQHYLRNSKEHRLIFCIAKSLLFLASHFECSDQIWSTLFLSSNQFNITCMYEMILAKSLRDPEVLLQRLESIFTLDENQQVSLLSVVHIFLYLTWDAIASKDVNKIVSFLHLSLHKGQNRELSEFTKLILISLILETRKSRLYKPIVETLYKSLKRLTVNEKKSLPPHLQTRLFLHELHSVPYVDFGLYISNVEPSNLSNTDKFRMLRIRQAIKSVVEIEKGQEIIANLNLGTPNESTINSNPKPQPIQKNRSAISNGNLFVVSPWIDNVNSLNDLIKNCVSFGVRTLVLSDSINLSAETREDLEILQINPELFSKYLRGKKIENYNIVGIENIKITEYLNECSSRQNTVVVLGNDRLGTPDNLKHLLDYTVQLPLEEVQNLQHLPIFMYSKQT